MCECGCTMNDERYRFPGPDKSFYLLTLSGGCVDCDAGPGVSIELIEPNNSLYREYKRGEFTNGKLRFEKWPDSKGAAVVVGYRQHEFIRALLQHLIGVSSEELGENGVIDEAGAEVILEEMYEDAMFRPKLVTQANAK